jgi:hypothetical protein
VASSSQVNNLLFGHNIFKNNAGYIDATAVYIRARSVLGTGIYSSTPTGATPYCAGYHFESNVFQNNIGCTGVSGGPLIFECCDAGEPTDSVGRDSNAETRDLFGSAPAGWAAMSHSWANVPYSVYWNGWTYIQNMNANTYTGNSYIGNFGTHGRGIVSLQGSTRALMSSETYSGNGEMTAEVFAQYGTYGGKVVLT